MNLPVIEPLSADTLSAVAQKMQEMSSISFSGTKNTSTTTASKDTATISETGVKISSSRQPSQEELNAMAWTGKQFVEMFEDAGFIFGDSGFIPGLLDNGNYMHGTTNSGISIDIDRHTEASENASLEPNELDTSNVLGYSASITTSSGKLDISFVDSVWMQQMEDGRTLIYYKESDTTRSFSSDGSYTEESGNLLKSDADTIIINVSGDLHTGNGNNLIFNWAEGATISTGDGDDTILLAEGMKDVRISTGNGNDKVVGGEIENSTIDLGSGNNELYLDKATASILSSGGGNALVRPRNRVQTADDGTVIVGGLNLDNSSLALGKGAHNVTIGAATNGSHISLASYRAHENYRNAATLRIGALIDSSFAASGYGYNLLFGDIVNGTIDLSGKGAAINFFANTVKNTRIDIDAQMAQMNIGTFTGNSSLTTAKGAYGFSFGEISGDATVSIGGGHTYLRVDRLTGNAHLAIGSGSSLNASFNEISGNAVLTLGDIYSSSVGIGALLGNAVVKMGHGDKTIIVERMGDNATLDAGSGSALIGIGRLEGNAVIRGGTALVVDNQSGQRRENVLDSGALPPQSRHAAMESFWKELSAAHRVMPPVERKTLDMFRPGM